MATVLTLFCSFFRHQCRYQPDHERRQRQPEQGTEGIEQRVCVGDLPRDNFQLFSLRRQQLHQPHEPRQGQQADQSPREVNAAMGGRRPFGGPGAARRR